MLSLRQLMHAGQPEKFKNGIFSLKRAFRPLYPGEILKRNNHCSIWRLLDGKWRDYRDFSFSDWKLRGRFRNPSTLKRKASVFKSFRFKEHFPKAPFLGGLYSLLTFFLIGMEYMNLYGFTYPFSIAHRKPLTDENVPINFQPQEDMKVNLILI